MTPTTPSGTRTRSMVMPFGRVQLSVTAPTGSGRSRTTSIPSAIAATILAVSVSRSRNAAFVPAAFTSATSSALAARIPAWLSRIARAIALSAASRWLAGDNASLRAATLARRPMSAIASAMLVPSIDFNGTVMRASGGGSLSCRNFPGEAQKKGRRGAPSKSAQTADVKRSRFGDHDRALGDKVRQEAAQIAANRVVILVGGAPDRDRGGQILSRTMPGDQVFGQPAGHLAGLQFSGDRLVQACVHRGISTGRGAPITPDAAPRFRSAASS